MDVVIKFYWLFGLPIGSSQMPASGKILKLTLVWASVSLFLVIYHTGHVWFLEFIHLLRTEGRVMAFGRISNYMTKEGSTLVIRVVLLSESISWIRTKSKSSLDSVLYDGIMVQSVTIKALRSGLGDKHLSQFVSRSTYYVLAGQLIFSFYAAALSVYHIETCFTAADMCNTGWLTPGLDHIGDLITEALQITTGSLVPIVSGIVCLRFAHCMYLVGSHLSQTCDSFQTAAIIRLAMQCVDSQSRYVSSNIRRWILGLVSLISINLVCTVFRLVRYTNPESAYFFVWVGIQFGWVAFISIASDAAQEAKMKLLRQMRHIAAQSELSAWNTHSTHCFKSFVSFD